MGNLGASIEPLIACTTLLIVVLVTEVSLVFLLVHNMTKEGLETRPASLGLSRLRYTC